MDQAIVGRAADWLRSILTAEIVPPLENLELSDMGHDHYRLSFTLNDANRTFPMPAAWVEGIADGNEAIREQVRRILLELVRT